MPGGRTSRQHSPTDGTSHRLLAKSRNPATENRGKSCHDERHRFGAATLGKTIGLPADFQACDRLSNLKNAALPPRWKDLPVLRAARLIALYLDFLTWSVVVGLITYALGDPSYISWAVQYAIALVLALLGGHFGLSPGRWLLARIELLLDEGGAPKAVWLNLLIGALFYLDASKHLVRWTLMDRPLPFMGIMPEGGMQVVFDLGFAVAFLLMAALMLRLHPLGKWVSGAGLVLLVVSTIVSWPHLPEAIARQVRARRDVQGLPLRDGEVEAFQGLYPTFQLVWAGLLLLLVLASYSRPMERPAKD